MIRGLMGGHEVTFEGRVFRLRSARLEHHSTRRVPVYLGAQGPRMTELSVRVADGVLVNWTNERKLLDAARKLGQLGVSSEKFEVGAHLVVSIHEDAVKARKSAIPFAAYIMTGTTEKVLSELGVDSEERDKVRRLLVASDWEGLYRVARDDWVKAFSFFGTPKRLEEFLHVLVSNGYTHVVLGPPWGPRAAMALRAMSNMAKRIRKEWRY